MIHLYSCCRGQTLMHGAHLGETFLLHTSLIIPCHTGTACNLCIFHRWKCVDTTGGIKNTFGFWFVREIWTDISKVNNIKFTIEI